jgi:hypothetical protein
MDYHSGYLAGNKKVQNLGLLLNGIGGGSLELPAKSLFFGGGGGGAGLFPKAPDPVVGGDWGGDAVLPEAKLLSLRRAVAGNCSQSMLHFSYPPPKLSKDHREDHSLFLVQLACLPTTSLW